MRSPRLPHADSEFSVGGAGAYLGAARAQSSTGRQPSPPLLAADEAPISGPVREHSSDPDRVHSHAAFRASIARVVAPLENCLRPRAGEPIDASQRVR